jgi:hypothetical protein
MGESSPSSPIAATAAALVAAAAASWALSMRRSARGARAVPVFVMCPLDAHEPGVLATLRRRWLPALRAAGVAGVAFDAWWRVAEPAPRVYHWEPFLALLAAAREAGLQACAVLSTHACGGNVGDDVDVPLPEWVLHGGSGVAGSEGSSSSDDAPWYRGPAHDTCTATSHGPNKGAALAGSDFAGAEVPGYTVDLLVGSLLLAPCRVHLPLARRRRAARLRRPHAHAVLRAADAGLRGGGAGVHRGERGARGPEHTRGVRLRAHIISC